MTWPVYSYLLASASSKAGSFEIGGPEPGYVWVVRFGTFTYGSFVGVIPRAALGLSPSGPWSWIYEGQAGSYVGIADRSASAWSHYVVGGGSTLYGNIEGVTGDLVLMGYKLTAQPA